MTDWTDFIKCQRGLLIAPAGHGKTTAIADCLLQCPEKSCQLILTHTHAGIASIRKKFQQKNIPSSKYQLETITGFAQRYVIGFLGSSVLPDEADKHYFSEAIEKCRVLMQSKLVQIVIQSSYDGVFVDEYQDCTIDQHEMIMKLAYNLPLHLLGDPLQGIFSFESKPLVDFDRDLGLFTRFDCLPFPWRWKDSNPSLGIDIFNIRQKLLNGEDIILSDNIYTQIFVEQYLNPHGEYDREYNRWLRRIINKHDSDSFLIICPSYWDVTKFGQDHLRGDLSDRISLKSIIDFSNKFLIIDAIDGSKYYSVAQAIDKYIMQVLTKRKIKKLDRLIDILDSLYINKTSVKYWIKSNRFISKNAPNADRGKTLKQLFQAFEQQANAESLFRVIDYVLSLPNIKCHHKEVFFAVKSCVTIAKNNKLSIFEAMKIYKSRIRHRGRSIEGRCIGTTLLTKGLEFDTVIVMDAHKFVDAKNFYVAISRACKKLIILTDNNILHFN